MRKQSARKAIVEVNRLLTWTLALQGKRGVKRLQQRAARKFGFRSWDEVTTRFTEQKG